ncbi:MAG: Intracellular protease [uncultured Paraburkholderia sp.]|nr:MAG: Intracellular protease [uncultured Paraburkholderia sp.]CAH2941059.1 MAG: Intracellular protease [uncultured Paraburkholderia sp.]
MVEDGNLITSRKPDDLPAFNRTFTQQNVDRSVIQKQGCVDPATAPWPQRFGDPIEQGENA